jgi:hypothetical protein
LWIKKAYDKAITIQATSVDEVLKYNSQRMRIVTPDINKVNFQYLKSITKIFRIIESMSIDRLNNHPWKKFIQA